jgi:hypothetical protein
VLGVYKDDSDSRQQIASYSSSYLTTPTVYWTDASTAYAYKSSERSKDSGCQVKSTSAPLTATSGGALLSLSSTTYEDPCRVAYLSSVTPSDKSTGNGAFTISIRSDVENRMSLADFDKMTVETQSDAFGVAQTTGSGTRGVVNN